MDKQSHFIWKYVVLTLSCTLLLPTTVSAQIVQDQDLSELSAGDEKVTAEMIDLVKHDAQIPVEEQNDKHQHLAQEQSDQIKKQTLEDNAVSDYEIKKKTDNSKLLTDKRKVYVPGDTNQLREIVIRESSLRFNSTGNVQGSGTASVKINDY